MHPVLPPHDFSLWTDDSFPKTPHREPTSCSHSVTCWFDHFFLFPRVKSEAIVARREPKEEVEDVSSYLCTELVYYITKMAVGKGGLCTTTLFMCDTWDADWSSLLTMRAKLVNCRLLLWDYLSIQLANCRLAKMNSWHSDNKVHGVLSAEQFLSNTLLSTFPFYLVFITFEWQSSIFSQGLVIVSLFEKTLCHVGREAVNCEDFVQWNLGFIGSFAAVTVFF